MNDMNTKQINIGFSEEEKLSRISDYLTEHPEITNIVYFHPDKEEPLHIDFPEVEIRTYSDIIMYRYFYPLLEHINHNYLLIYDECMRTTKRNDLTYNCAHHYSNQTDKIIVFEYFPMIQDTEEFMILVDLAYPNKYKSQHFEPSFLTMDGVEIKAHDISMNIITCTVSDEIKQRYEEEKEMLFDNIGMKDPDTIPRTLHIWCGTNVKKAFLSDTGVCSGAAYIARNGRFKKKNVYQYGKEMPARKNYQIVDFPVRHLQFNDFLKKTGAEELTFMHSGLSADNIYANDYTEWLMTLKEAFYDNSNIPTN